MPLTRAHSSVHKSGANAKEENVFVLEARRVLCNDHIQRGLRYSVRARHRDAVLGDHLVVGHARRERDDASETVCGGGAQQGKECVDAANNADNIRLRLQRAQ